MGAAAGVVPGSGSRVGLSVAWFLQLEPRWSRLRSLCQSPRSPAHLCLAGHLLFAFLLLCEDLQSPSSPPLLSLPSLFCAVKPHHSFPSSTPLLLSFFVTPSAYLNLIFFPLGHLEVIVPSSEPLLHFSYGTGAFHSAVAAFMEHLLYAARGWGCRGE